MKKEWGQALGLGQCFEFPSVLWHCWFGDRNGFRPVKYLCQGRLSQSSDGATEPWPILGEYFLKWKFNFNNNLQVKQHKFHHRCPIILNKNFVWGLCGGRLGGRPPGPTLELPLVGGNCAYVARGDRRPCLCHKTPNFGAQRFSSGITGGRNPRGGAANPNSPKRLLKRSR